MHHFRAREETLDRTLYLRDAFRGQHGDHDDDDDDYDYNDDDHHHHQLHSPLYCMVYQAYP